MDLDPEELGRYKGKNGAATEREGRAAEAERHDRSRRRARATGTALDPSAMGNANGNGPIQRPLTAYESMVRTLSDRLVEAQRPIRILDAIKWDDDIERAFFAAGCRKLPPVDRDYYLARPLPFDPEA